MIRHAKSWLFSARDLTTYLDCKRAAELDRLAHTDPQIRMWLSDSKRAERENAEAAGLPIEDPSVLRGLAHENAVLQEFKRQPLTFTEIATPTLSSGDGFDHAVAETTAAMTAGAEVIYQAALRDGAWFGFADFLVRRPGIQSRFGDYAYEVHDTKLARSVRTSALIQLGHYGLMLEVMQDTPPPRLVVALGTGERSEWPYDDTAPYTSQLRSEVLSFHTRQGSTIAQPIAACSSCRWLGYCDDGWGATDLKHVQRLTSKQRAALQLRGISDIHALAQATDEQRPAQMAKETFERLRFQAVVQNGEHAYEVIRPHPAVGALADVPSLHPLDIYFDLEGDPYAASPTLDYLWAYCDPDGNYHHHWAHDSDAERHAFLWLLEELRAREAQGGTWHVFHYNAYETASLRRIARDWPDDRCDSFVSEIDRLIRERFDDLYRRVEAGLRTRDGSTSLKIVEVLAGYDRTIDKAAVAKGDDSIRAYELAIAANTSAERRQQLFDGIEHYNRHDVRATAALHRWLVQLGGALDPSQLVHTETETYEKSEKLQERIDRTERKEKLLREAADRSENEGDLLPLGLSAEGARRLAGMLAWHRREESVQWGDFYRLCDWAQHGEAGIERRDIAQDAAWTTVNGDSALEYQTAIRAGSEHESVLQDLTIVRKDPPPAGTRKRKSRYTIQCRPGAWKVKAGEKLQPVALEGEMRGTADLQEFDAENGTAVLETTADLADAHALVLQPFAGQDTPWQSLMRLADAALGEDPDAAAVGLRLLDRHPPRALADKTDRSDPARIARDTVAAIDGGDLLAVQGPPGTGKTWLAAQIIADEIERARSRGAMPAIGVTANSHKVIDNLLVEALKVAGTRDLALAVAHVGDKSDDADPRIEILDSSSELAPYVAARRGTSALLVGATKYGWSRTDATGLLDLLIIDEAGQVPLADALSVVQSASRVLAVGDPQQLAPPIQAAHDAELRVSLLEHLIQGRPTIAPEAGVFLDVSHRMHPALCAVVGRLAYASSLHASAKAAARRLEGVPIEIAGMTLTPRPGVVHLPVSGGSEVEVAAVVELLAWLTSGEVRASHDASSEMAPFHRDDVLVVAPHNAHVNRLRHALPGFEIGTVDKFQGRQAHVVVYAMGRTAEVSSDVPFLYELNRVNVALSRARLLAVVVTSPEALLPPISEPQHLMLASRFIRAMRGSAAGVDGPI